MLQRARRDQAVEEDHVGARDQLDGAQRQQRRGRPGRRRPGGRVPVLIARGPRPRPPSAVARRPARRAPRGRRSPCVISVSRTQAPPVGAADEGASASASRPASSDGVGADRACGSRPRARRTSARSARRQAWVVGVVERRDGAQRLRVRGARGEREHALSGGRHELVELARRLVRAPESLAGPRAPARSPRSRRPARRRQARVDVAAQLHDLDVLAQRPQLCGAPQRARSDARASRQRIERRRAADRVARRSRAAASRRSRCRPAARRGRPWRSGRRGRSRRAAAPRRARASSAPCRAPRGRGRRSS